LDEVATYAFEFDIIEKFSEFVVTLNFFFDGLTTLPYSLRERVFSSLQENKGNYVFSYEVFRDFDISFPLAEFESDLLSMLSIAHSQFHPNSWTFTKALQILCNQLGFTPASNTFMYLYQLKHDAKVD